MIRLPILRNDSNIIELSNTVLVQSDLDISILINNGNKENKTFGLFFRKYNQKKC
jgi:hypothetical protein